MDFDDIELSEPFDDIELSEPFDDIELSEPSDDIELSEPSDDIELSELLNRIELSEPSDDIELSELLDRIEFLDLPSFSKNGQISKGTQTKKSGEHTKYFEKGVRQDWHHYKAFKENVLLFGELYARQPEMSEAKEMHTKIMKRVEEDLKGLNIFYKLEFVGSSYEGVKVTDLEFDVMVIMKTPLLEKEMIEGKSNFVLLKPANEDSKQQLIEFIGGSDHISSSKVTDFFFRHLQKCCNSLDEKVHLRKHGPAIQLDVYKSDGKIFYSVDVVPTIAVNNERYVAKQLKTEPSYKADLTWRITYSIEEKNLLVNIDEGNGCRKQVLRILKAIRNSEPSLHGVTSYILKNVLLRVNSKLKVVKADKKDPWHINNIGSRLMDVIRELRDEFNDGFVPCYFNGGINLIEDLKPITVANIKNRFKHFLNSYKLMKKVLKVAGKGQRLNA